MGGVVQGGITNTKDLRERPYAFFLGGGGVPAGITAGRETNLEAVEGKLSTAGLDPSGLINISRES